MVAVQIKKGYGQPTYLREWLKGITEHARGKVGCVVWGAKGARDDDAVVILRLADFATLLARLENRQSLVEDPVDAPHA